MTSIEKRIQKLEKKAGIDKDIISIRLVRFISPNENENPKCPAFTGDTHKLCIRYKEFCQTKLVNDNSISFFLLDCEGCEGVQDDYAEAGGVDEGRD